MTVAMASHWKSLLIRIKLGRVWVWRWQLSYGAAVASGKVVRSAPLSNSSHCSHAASHTCRHLSFLRTNVSAIADRCPEFSDSVNPSSVEFQRWRSRTWCSALRSRATCCSASICRGPPANRLLMEWWLTSLYPHVVFCDVDTFQYSHGAPTPYERPPPQVLDCLVVCESRAECEQSSSEAKRVRCTECKWRIRRETPYFIGCKARPMLGRTERVNARVNNSNMYNTVHYITHTTHLYVRPTRN